MPLMTTNPPRLTHLAFGLSVLCGCTSSSADCEDQNKNNCRIDLSGPDAYTNFGEDKDGDGEGDHDVALLSSKHGTARFTLDGVRVSCTEGQVLSVSIFWVTCKEVSQSSLTLQTVTR